MQYAFFFPIFITEEKKKENKKRETKEEDEYINKVERKCLPKCNKIKANSIYGNPIFFV